MNTLFVIHYATYGGPHNQILILHRHLLSKGFRTTVVLPEEPGNAYRRLTDKNLDVLKIALHRARASLNVLDHIRFFFCFFIDINSLRKAIREKQIGIVIAAGLVNPHAAIAAACEKVPFVWQILDTRTPFIIKLLLLPLVKLLSDAVMCTGLKTAELHPGLSTVGNRLHFYFPPVDPDRFKPDPQKRIKARMHLGIGEKNFVIGSVGNITPQKGYEYLIQATTFIRSKIPNFKIRILGDTLLTHRLYKTRLDVQAHSIGLTETGAFSITDPEDRVAELIPAFDIFVLSSVPRSEGIPTAILEAMSCGIPVIATNVGSVMEVVEHRVTGLIVPPKNVQALSDAIISLYSDPILLKQMSLNSRLKVLNHHTLERCTKSHVRAFMHATERHFHRN